MKAIDLVQTNALPGQHDAFNEWYDGRHLRDILSVPGIVTAQRYRLHPSRRVDGKGYDDLAKPFEYLAIYEIDRDPLDILRGIEEAREAGRIPWSPALDPVFSAYFYEPIGEHLVKDE